MENLDKYYKLAFAYKKKKLWTRIDDNNIFAIKLDDGQIGFVSILGSSGEYNSINLYPGLESILYFKDIFEIDDIVSDYDKFLSTLDSTYYQLVLGNRIDITKKEADDIEAYKKKNSLNIRGSLSMPYFRKSTPFAPMVEFNKKEDYHYIEQALEASLALADILEEKSPKDIGLGIMPLEDKLILLEKLNGKYVLSDTIDIDWKNNSFYTRADMVYMSTAKKLKKLRKKTDVECKLIALSSPVYEKGSDPYYPQLLLALEKRRGTIIPVKPIKNYRKNPNAAVNNFLESIMKEGLKPVKISVSDKRTYFLLEDTCMSLKIDLVLDKDLYELEMTRREFDAKFSGNPYNDSSIGDMMIEILDQLDNLKDIKNMGESIPDEIIYLIADSVISGEFDNEFKNLVMTRLDELSDYKLFN